MELIIDDFAVKVVVKKRKSMTDPAHSKLGTLPAAKGKEINNCQVGLRKNLVGSDVGNMYHISFKNSYNRQIGKDIILTFAENIGEDRVSLIGDTIVIRPDKMHSIKKGLEIDSICVTFGTVDLVERWYKILSDMAKTYTERSGEVKNINVVDEFALQTDTLEPQLKKKKDPALLATNTSVQRSGSTPVKKKKSVSGGVPPIATDYYIQQQQLLSQQQHQEQQQLLKQQHHQQHQLQKQIQHTNEISASDMNTIVQAIKDLHTQNTLLNQKVIMLTQDVAYLKSQLQPNAHHSPLNSPHVVVTNAPLIPSPHQNSPLASPHITHNPFATNSPLTSSNPQFTNQYTPVKPVTNPFNTNY